MPAKKRASNSRESALKRNADENEVNGDAPLRILESAVDLSASVQSCYCGICLDAMVSATILEHCGHVFCRACLESCQNAICPGCSQRHFKCPTCREWSSAYRCWAVDRMIRAHMQLQSKNMAVSFFPADDVQTFRGRIEKLKSALKPPRPLRAILMRVASNVAEPVAAAAAAPNVPPLGNASASSSTTGRSSDEAIVID
jgi:RING-type zinc-finger